MNQFKSFSQFVKKNLPLEISIQRKRVPIDLFGYCKKIGINKYEIVIDPEVSEQTACFVLIHELSHAIEGCKEDHTSKWGKYYAQAYSLWEKYLEEGDE